MTMITGKTFDEERALYAAQDIVIKEEPYTGSRIL